MFRIRTGSRIGLLVAALVFVFIGVGVLLGANRLIADAAVVSHTHEVIGRVDELVARLRDAESAQRGYRLTGNATYLADYLNARALLPGAQAGLANATRDNLPQRARAEALGAIVQRRVEQMEGALERYRIGALPAAEVVANAEALRASTEIRRQAAVMSQVERHLLGARADSSVESAYLLRGLALLGIPMGLLLIALVYALLLAEIRRRARAEADVETANLDLRASLQRVERASADLGVLSHYGSLLQSCVTPIEALELTRRMLGTLLPDVGGGLYRLRDSQDFLERAVAWGGGAEALPEMIPVDACWALRRGQPYVAKAPLTAPCPHVAAHAHDAIEERMCLPLVAQGKQLGLLYLEDPGKEVSAREAIVHTVAEQLSMALATLTLQDRLREQSIRDPLTGLFNRRYLEEAALRELARCMRRGLPLSILMIDIDHFKVFNDVHGHAGGDAALAEFGELVRSMTRDEDVACRYGGEEFTLIMPEADVEAACARADALRVAVAGMKAHHLGKLLPPVTVSIGVASNPEHGATFEAVMLAADAALYRAKQLGRNRVQTAWLQG